MILVTVGMQLGFDRLIEAMDALAPSLGERIVAQTGKGEYRPQNMEAHPSLDASRFKQLASEAKLIVSHAGIGTVLTAQRLGVPILLVPRQAALGEHRNDHQMATVKQLEGRAGILVATDTDQLADRIAQGLAMDVANAPPSATSTALNSAVATFIETGSLPSQSGD